MDTTDADRRSPVFVARKLTKIYRMGEVAVRALSDLDLEIRAGEFIVLLGPSGSGKSTLLNILGGLDTPTSGEAFWRDHNLVTADEAELTRYRREHVGFVFQFYNLIPSLTVRENVALVTDIAVSPMPAEEALDARRAVGDGSTTSRRSFRAASSSASRSRARSSSARTCCSATSRPARSTIRPARSCWR